MKKLVYATLVISIIFQAIIGSFFESYRETQKLKDNESIYCTSFAIPDDKDISDPEKLFSVFLRTAEETHANLFRTYMKGGDYIEVVKYILLTRESEYNQTFALTKGRALTPGETKSRSSKCFLSTQNSENTGQTGKLYGHMFHMDLSIYPFYQMFSDLKASGRYFAELPAGENKEVFLQCLQKNIMKEFNKKIPVKSLEGDSLHVEIPTVDISSYQYLCAILLLLLIAFLLYALFRESKHIAILKLNGISTWKILWLLLGKIFIVFACSIISIAIAIGIYTGEWPYVWLVLKNSVGMYILTLILLLVVGVADVRACRVHQNLNGKSNSKNVFCLNMVVKALSILLVLSVGQTVYINFMDYRKNMNLYKAWGDASYYGTFNAFKKGSSITFSDMIQAEGKIAKDVYPVVNRQGALFINAHDFQPEYLSQPSQQYPSVTVNPNYLKKYSLLDSFGKPVEISENETNWVLLAPVHYKSQEKKLIKYFETIRAGMNEVDRQEYGVSVKESKGQSIKIIWIKDGQEVYTYNSKVSPETAGTVSNALVQVLTEHNSCIADRDCVHGNGASDPLKIKLHGTKQETYNQLLPTLKEVGVAENLTHFVSIDQYMMEKATEAKSQTNLFLLITIVLAAVLLFIIVQNMAIIFDRNQKDIIVKKLFGWQWYRRFGKYIGISMSVSVIVLCAYCVFSFVTGSVEPGYLVGSSLLLLAVEAAVSFITILHTENRKAVDTLKGE